jgi:hypothetical protein
MPGTMNSVEERHRLAEELGLGNLQVPRPCAPELVGVEEGCSDVKPEM